MTALSDTREVIVEHGLDAQVQNAVQARLIYNPTPDVDSLVEIFGALASMDLTDRARLALVSRGMRITRAIAAGNRAEREHVRAITGAAEQLGRKALTVKDAARRLRAPLADLANPIVTGARRADAHALVVAVLEDAPAGLLHDEAGRPRAGIAGELNSVVKTTALAAVIAAHTHGSTAAA